MASVEFTKVNLPKDDSYIKNVFVPILSESSVLGFTYDFLDDFERIKKGKTRKRCIFEFCGITLGLLLGYLLVYLLINWHPIAAFVGIIFSFQNQPIPHQQLITLTCKSVKIM